MKVLGICGSLRAASANLMLLNEAVRVLEPAEYVAGDLRLPLYDGDLEAAGMPAGVTRLHGQIGAADAVIIACPEYNKALPGLLKNALDWVSRIRGNPWLDKPVAVVSAAGGRGGGDRAQFSLRLCLVPLRARVLPGPEVLIAGAGDEFDAAGRLTSDRYLRTLGELMAELRREAGR